SLPSTLVKRSASASLSVGWGVKNRSRMVSGERRPWKATRLSLSSGRMGRTCTVAPSVRTASNSGSVAGTRPVYCLVAHAAAGDEPGLDPYKRRLLTLRPRLDRQPGHPVLKVAAVEGRHLIGDPVDDDAPSRPRLPVDAVDLEGDGRMRGCPELGSRRRTEHGRLTIERVVHGEDERPA